MNVLIAIVAGWLGLNAFLLVIAGIVAWVRRHEPIRLDIHDLANTEDPS